MLPRKFIDCSVPLEQISPAEVGGKAWNLFRLLKAGVPVPRFCVLSTCAFKDTLDAARHRILQCIERADFERQSSLEKASGEIEAIIGHGVPGPFLSDDVMNALSAWISQGRSFAVRSSMAGEDGPKESFAGIFSSSLNVRSAEVLEHVLWVWLSAFSPRALAYICRKDLALERICPAVIIQDFVPAQQSGVMFTADPDTGERGIIISAGYGLGEGVVNNLVETDTYRTGFGNQQVHRTVVQKKRSVVAACGGRSGTRLAGVAGLTKYRPVLKNRQIRQLRDIALAIEQCVGDSQDIEWGYDRDGKLFVLQARPVIFSRASKSCPTVRVWDNANIVESYPGITLPLTFSFIREAYERIFQQAMWGFVRVRDRARIDPSIFAGMVGLLRGSVYYNLLNWYKILSWLPGFQRHKLAWESMIGIDHPTNMRSSRLPFLSQLKAFCRLADILFMVARRAKKFECWFHRTYQKHNDARVEDLSLDAAIGRYRRIAADVETSWHETLYNDFAAMTYYHWLKHLCARWIRPSSNLHNDLLRGEEGIESVEPLRSLLRIVDAVQRHPGGSRLLLEGTSEEKAWACLQSDPSLQDLRLLIDDHLARFGDRALEELKLESPTFRERPSSLLALVRQYALDSSNLFSGCRREDGIRMQAEILVRRSLRSPLRRILFSFVLRNARQAITARENMRFSRSRVYGIARKLFRRVGTILAAGGVLDRSDDVFYLTVPEIIGLAEGTGTGEPPRKLVSLRKEQYASYDTSPSDRFETAGIPSLAEVKARVSGLSAGPCLRGTGCSSGRVKGKVRIVRNPGAVESSRGQILVASSTDPGWVFLIVRSLGIIVERGSVLSHTAIIGRELGIPTIVGVRGATNVFRDGVAVEMDGGTGEIRWA